MVNVIVTDGKVDLRGTLIAMRKRELFALSPNARSGLSGERQSARLSYGTAICILFYSVLVGSNVDFRPD